MQRAPYCIAALISWVEYLTVINRFESRVRESNDGINGTRTTILTVFRYFFINKIRIHVGIVKLM